MCAAVKLEESNIQLQLDNLYNDLTGFQYKLTSVCVHSGGSEEGHYWIFVLDDRSDTWMRIDDYRVELGVCGVA